LAVGECAPEPVGSLATDHVHGAPEIRGACLVRYILQHSRDLALPDFVEDLSRELEVVALLVERPGSAVLDDNSPIRVGNYVIDRGVCITWKERYVRHALELNGIP